MNKDLPDIDAVRRRVRSCGLTYAEIEERSGLSYSWIAQFAQGVQRNPRYSSLSALLAALPEEGKINDKPKGLSGKGRKRG